MNSILMGVHLFKVNKVMNAKVLIKLKSSHMVTHNLHPLVILSCSYSCLCTRKLDVCKSWRVHFRGHISLFNFEDSTLWKSNFVVFNKENAEIMFLYSLNSVMLSVKERNMYLFFREVSTNNWQGNKSAEFNCIKQFYTAQLSYWVIRVISLRK